MPAVSILPKFDPTQPRAPAGTSTGGQWVSGGGSSDEDKVLFDKMIPASLEHLREKYGDPVVHTSFAPSIGIDVPWLGGFDTSTGEISGVNSYMFDSHLQHQWGHYLDWKIGGSKGVFLSDSFVAARDKDEASLKGAAFSGDPIKDPYAYVMQTLSLIGTEDLGIQLFNDFLQAVTGGAFGAGHLPGYWNNETRSREMFADAIALESGDYPKSAAFARNIAPNWYAEFDKIIKQGGKSLSVGVKAMPMSPHAGEDQSDFMKRCVPEMMGDGKREQDQAVAICLDIWRKKDATATETKDHGPPREGESRDDFMARCTSYEDMDEESCAAMWDEHHGEMMGDKGLEMSNRAWSTLAIKGMNTEQRTIEGIASTPEVDRVGDIVDPMGGQFKLPMPLLWHHDHKEPVGHVIEANARKDGIFIKAQFAKVDEEGELKKILDKAWQSVKAGLVRGLSIGFKPVAGAVKQLDNGGFHYLKWNWYELSCVAIPANTGATISVIKSHDVGLPVASDKKEVIPGVKVRSVTKGVKIETGPVEREITFEMSPSQISAFQMTNPEWRMKRCERSHLLYQDGEPLFSVTFVASI